MIKEEDKDYKIHEMRDQECYKCGKTEYTIWNICSECNKKQNEN